MLTGLNSSNLMNDKKKTSYCFNTMSRIETMKKAIIQTEQLVNKTKESVEIELNKILKNGNLTNELQKLNIKIKMLKDQLDKERFELEILKKRNSSLTNIKILNQTINQLNNNSSSNQLNDNSTNNQLNDNSTNNQINDNQMKDNLSDNQLNDNQPKSNNDQLQLNLTPSSSSPLFIKELNRELITFNNDKFEKDKQLINKIENEILIKSDLLDDLNRSLSFTENKLINELFMIFPIRQSQNDGKYTILGLQLPDLNEHLDDNNIKMRISLGFCCQLLITLSKIIDLPLKHEIEFNGSEIWILNETTDNPRLKDKKYPLFLYKDKFKFNVGICLLNENIVQLRHHFNLQANDPKNLPFNLFGLFNDKLLKRDDN